MQRAVSTVTEYLAEYIAAENPPSIDAWVPNHIYKKVSAAAAETGTGSLKPIFVALDEKVPYDQIRLVIAHLRTRQNP